MGENGGKFGIRTDKNKICFQLRMDYNEPEAKNLEINTDIELDNLFISKLIAPC